MLTKSQNASRHQETRTRMEDLLTKMTVKDRAGIEKHLAVCDTGTDPTRGEIWRRLAGLLGQLVSLPARTSGPHALTFFIPDGKYRKQVFALEDRGDGTVFVYLPDITAKAIREKLIAKAEGGFSLPGSRDVFGELVDGNMPELPNHIKPMLGWNRKALKHTLGVGGPESQRMQATE